MYKKDGAKKKVLVAMSGGVDSSVAAVLLKEQGYMVMGGFMKNFSAESWHGVINECPWKEDVKDVEDVCEKLGIEYRAFNFEKEYENAVINYFFNEYANGRTPNPDIRCNSFIKFGIFLEKAKELGFDYIATGHYARVHKEYFGTQAQPPLYHLLKGVDENKDQSYFLYRLTQEQLSHTLFPIGEYTKTQVRKLARSFDLPNAEKKDSQGVCFIGHINLSEFLKQRIPEREGEIVTANGTVVGKHKNAAYYTIGQRHGLGIGGGTPYYVAQKDMAKNRLIVAEGQYDRIVYYTSVEINDIHWVSGRIPKFPLECAAKIRYRQNSQKVRVRQADGNKLKVVFEKEQFAPAAGQSIVFYKNNAVLGGGVII